MSISGIDENAVLNQYKEVQRTTDQRRFRKEPAKNEKAETDTVRPVQLVQDSFKIEQSTEAVSVLRQIKAAVENPDNREMLSRLNQFNKKTAVRLLE